MRIGVDAHLVKRQPTGVGKTIARTIEAMVDAASDEFVVYANRDFPDTLAEQDRCRVARTPLIAKSRVLRVLHERFVVPRRARRDRLDVFYAPGYVFPGPLPVPMVLGIFDLNALKHPKRVRRETAFYYKHLMPLSAERAERIIAPTRAVARDVVDILNVPDDRVRVVPLAADDRFRDAAPASHAVLARYGIRKPYVLFVGNIEPNKNLDRLVQAFFAARLNRDLPHTLIIAGKRRHRATDLERLVDQLGCAEHVRFPGYIDDADLPGLYAAAAAFVYPSHAEGFGIPPLEAMLAGTPTVTSRDAAVAEVTGDGAMHVRADDTAAFREALERVLTDPGFAAGLVERGRTVAARYSWAETGRQTLDVIHEAGERKA
jgi:glycosyltransferase involved in cell wall biosynthesis